MCFPLRCSCGVQDVAFGDDSQRVAVLVGWRCSAVWETQSAQSALVLGLVALLLLELPAHPTQPRHHCSRPSPQVCPAQCVCLQTKGMVNAAGLMLLNFAGTKVRLRAVHV